MSKEYYLPSELYEYKELQRLAYDAVIWTESKLTEGITEKETTKLIEQYLKNHGVKQFFHLPFAWFGNRSAFHNFSMPLDPTKKLSNFKITKHAPIPHLGLEFMPSNRKLEKGMCVILDVAPVINSKAADIGYSFSFGENDLVSQAKNDLAPFRTLILELANQKSSLKDIYLACDQLIEKNGYQNCHQKYPLGVLGHKIGKLPGSYLPKLNILGFHPQSFLFLLGHLGKSLKNKQDNIPFMTPTSEVPLEPGLWAIEPHISKGEIGVKFEEIMVVTDDHAYWLDDHLPHVEYWNNSLHNQK